MICMIYIQIYLVLLLRALPSIDFEFLLKNFLSFITHFVRFADAETIFLKPQIVSRKETRYLKYLLIILIYKSLVIDTVQLRTSLNKKELLQQ